MVIQYLAVLDFEATCWKNSNDHEIIEFPTVIIDLDKKEVVDKIQIFVRPVKNPCLSEFCKELTGIKQEWVDKGIDLEEAIKLHSKFLSKYDNLIIVTCGDWDLKTMLPQETQIRKLIVPSVYGKWINIKRIFKEFYKRDKELGMVGMLNKLDLKLLGRHHSGLDDCVNIAQICIKLVNSGWNPSNVKI